MVANSKKRYSGEVCSDKEGSFYRREAKEYSEDTGPE